MYLYIIKNTLCCRSLSGINMRHNTDVSGSARGYSLPAKIFSSSIWSFFGIIPERYHLTCLAKKRECQLPETIVCKRFVLPHHLVHIFFFSSQLRLCCSFVQEFRLKASLPSPRSPPLFHTSPSTGTAKVNQRRASACFPAVALDSSCSSIRVFYFRTYHVTHISSNIPTAGLSASFCSSNASRLAFCATPYRQA